LTKRSNPHEFPCLAGSDHPPASTTRLRATTERSVPSSVGPALALFFHPRQVAHLEGQSAKGAPIRQDDDNCFQGTPIVDPALRCRWRRKIRLIQSSAAANNDCRTSTSCWVGRTAAARSRTLAHDPAGNDPELDPNRPADPPTKAIDKPVARAGKRDGPDSKAPVERVGNTRPKQTANANDNGTSTSNCALRARKRSIHATLHGTRLTDSSFPGSWRRCRQEPQQGIRW
jgi:hypothetical protein